MNLSRPLIPKVVQVEPLSLSWRGQKNGGSQFFSWGPRKFMPTTFSRFFFPWSRLFYGLMERLTYKKVSRNIIRILPWIIYLMELWNGRPEKSSAEKLHSFMTFPLIHGAANQNVQCSYRCFRRILLTKDWTIQFHVGIWR